MEKISKSLILICIMFLFTACSSKNPPLQTVEKVDLERYLGTWYEIARYEHFFEKDCKNVSANYSIMDEETIKVINKCTKIQTNEKKEAMGRAYAIDETNSKLKVSFFRPFYGDYWVLILDENYEYAVVGTPNREYLWILARDKKLPLKIQNDILEKLPSLGFDISKLLWTMQEK
ncbi:lipocalin domain-containing protein [Arcobacter acticola]|jgi:apolipoprotein D and lipocalin family protein|uniref:Outer membrane lipoprotein Blc n=1 Tax=Arcobacter acticola TaxID=1849015 RepID=A0A6M8EK51_9BACT|nr:lipocalin family protein [Arcobacter acticola]QKE28858.1 lipocalin domain-containing protein [Arcobacter acticola]